MSSNSESGHKISLSMLRGKSAGQSVPSISFRFNASCEDIVPVKDHEEIEADQAIGTEKEQDTKSKETSTDGSPSKDPINPFTRRSSSLDYCSGPDEKTVKPLATESSSLLSKITKTFEDKFQEIRTDKQKAKEQSSEPREIQQITSELSEKLSVTSKESKSDTNSPTRNKTSIVQDISEQFKSELNKSFGPKLSELRNRKNSKDATKTQHRSSLFTSLLGREEGIAVDASFNDEPIDTAIEAKEEFLDSFDEIETDLSNFKKLQSNDTIEPICSKSVSQRCSTPIWSDDITQDDSTHLGNLYLLLSDIINNVPNFWSKKRFLQVSMAVFAICFVFPIPRFLAGLIFGILISLFICLCLFSLLMPAVTSQELAQTYTKLQNVPEACTDDNLQYKGWLNELDGDYSPETYHVSLTHSVFVRLQGSILKIYHPIRKVNKHARVNETLHSGGFHHHREYNLLGCKATLLPINLPRKWMWSRKYPMCLQLNQSKSKCMSVTPTSEVSTPSKSPPLSPLHKQMDDLHLEESLNSSSDFEEVSQDMCMEKSITLFARSDREKDDWFRRFVKATEITNAGTPTLETEEIVSKVNESDLEGEKKTGDKVEPKKMAEKGEGEAQVAAVKKELKFDSFIAELLHKDFNVESNVCWFNALIGRILYDVLRNPYWANKIQERVQRKLSKLHLPYFVGELVVNGVYLGTTVPQLQGADSPSMDARGMWVEFDMKYYGNFTMSLETKLDLMKLKQHKQHESGSNTSQPASSNPPSPGDEQPSFVPKPQLYTRSPSFGRRLRDLKFETDTDDSVESSSEEEGEDEGLVESFSGGSGPTSRKLLRIVDTVAASKYFQQASEWRLLQRAMQGVSNTRIELAVEVQRLEGRLVVNIPPLPSDRFWYGFRGIPELVMVARPRLGDRVLNLPFLAEFIQKQLRVIFEKVFVLPNMDDLVIPVMSPLLPGQIDVPKPPWEYSPPSQLPSELTYIPPSPTHASDGVDREGSVSPH